MARRLLVVALALVVLVAIGAGWLRGALYGGSDVESGDTVHFVVREGQSLRSVAADLVDVDLLEAAWRLVLVERIEGGGRRVRAGEYDLPRGSSPAELLAHLVDGPLRTRAVTLPEGWTAARVVEVVADSLGVERAVLDSLVQRPPAPWRRELELPDGATLEGYLFPETYRFTRGVAADRAVRTMLDAFGAVVVDSVRRRLDERGLTLHEWVTLASIVEAEASVDDEFEKVAAVYTNRIERGWKLEADPTVAYATGKIGERLTFRDLEVDSPYNTYRNPGLPPGPINNPGRRALLATLWPEPDFDAMYFVADGAGGHRFSRTWEEHKAAVRLYRAWQREQREDGGG